MCVCGGERCVCVMEGSGGGEGGKVTESINHKSEEKASFSLPAA